MYPQVAFPIGEPAGFQDSEFKAARGGQTFGEDFASGKRQDKAICHASTVIISGLAAA